ncbi:cyclophilin-like fold protein [Chryseobacterium sp. CY353]|nr:cyclophilin-like fold protein [Chryseobacterium sp. CY353]
MQKFFILIAYLPVFSFSIIASSIKNVETFTQNNKGNYLKQSTSKMKITIGTAVFTGTLYNNSSSEALKVMFPLIIKMTELNENEKYFHLAENLPTSSTAHYPIKSGDLMLYGNNTLVLFYKNFTTSYSYTKLGKIDNPAGLSYALGRGNVTVKFELINKKI